MSNFDQKKSHFYARQTTLKEVGEIGQKKLEQTNVLIVGAGGLGHPVATYLAASGIGNITILDFDKIDESNLNRQTLFTPNDVGLFKSQILAKKISLQNPYIKVKSINDKIDVSNVEKYLKNVDLIMDCTDNFYSKYLLHDCAWFLKKNLVQASIFQFEGQIQTFDYSEKTSGGCLRCLWPNVPRANCTGNCQESGIIGAVAGSVGSIQAMEAIKLILSIGENLDNTTLTVDLLTYILQKLKWKKNNNCPLCGSNAIIHSMKEGHYIDKQKFEINGEIPNNISLIDIREEAELEVDGNIKLHFDDQSYSHQPLSEFDVWKDKLKMDEKYLFFCQKGIRSSRLVAKLRQEKYKNSYSLYGGVNNLILKSQK